MLSQTEQNNTMSHPTELEPAATVEEPSESNPSPKDAPLKSEDTAEDFSLITTGEKIKARRVKAIDDDEPLVDTTVALPKRSKKTERATKRLMRKQQKLAQHRGPATFCDLPAELLEHILSYLRATDVLALLPTNRNIHAFITSNEPSISRSIIRRRYAVLGHCFPLPKPFTSIPSPSRPALLSEARQNLLQIHKRPYHHVQPFDPERICTCMTCTLAWNNLNMIVDLSHWQRNLNRRDPIPMIPRGKNPAWNQELLARNAELVRTAMARPIFYTLILQRHLETTVSTIRRTLRGQKTVHPKRVYHLSKPEAESGIETDYFLEQNGPESYEFPYHRDNYYNLNAYVPNRKWSRQEERWMYYPSDSMHERDLQWVVERFVPSEGAKKAVGGESGQGKGEGEQRLDGPAAQFHAHPGLSGISAAVRAQASDAMLETSLATQAK